MRQREIWSGGGIHNNTELILGVGGSGIGTYELSGGNLNTEDLIIGLEGQGTFIQTGGFVDGQNPTEKGSIYIGYAEASKGTYDLRAGSIQTDFAKIGHRGIGNYIHSGGSNSIKHDLFLGLSTDGRGTYQLSGSGLLGAAREFVGAEGFGEISQSGGANNTGELTLGYADSAVGIYTLSDGWLLATNQYIGNMGSGRFTQSGGTNNAVIDLVLALFWGSGEYRLRGGLLKVGGKIIVNAGGTFIRTAGTLEYGEFWQNGGTVQGDIANYTSYSYQGGGFEGFMENYGLLRLYADFTAGRGLSHYSDFTLEAGRTLTLNGEGLANYGRLALAGGVLTGDGPLVNYATLTGHGTIGGSGGFVNHGTFTQGEGDLFLNNTGNNLNHGNFSLAVERTLNLGEGTTLKNWGSFSLLTGAVAGPGTLENLGGTIMGPGLITSKFANSGGELLVQGGLTNVTQDFTNQGRITMKGLRAGLAGGAISNLGILQGTGTVGRLCF
jgi:hypothetical protein